MIRAIVTGIVTDLLIGLSNCFFRGGGLETAVLNGNNWKWGRLAHVLLIGGLSWHQSGSVAFALSCCVGMTAGMAPGWREYISAINQDGTINNHSRIWGLTMFTLRALFWGACVVASVWVAHHFGWLPSTFHVKPWAILTMACFSTQGVVYWGVRSAWRHFGWKPRRWIDFYKAYEVVYGNLYGIPFALLPLFIGV